MLFSFCYLHLIAIDFSIWPAKTDLSGESIIISSSDDDDDGDGGFSSYFYHFNGLNANPDPI